MINDASNTYWEHFFSLLARLLVWSGFFGLLYLLQSFFALIFLTFVFAYIQNSGVLWLENYLENRVARVILVGIVFLGFLVTISLFLAPGVAQQTKGFITDLKTYVHKVDQMFLDLTEKYPSLAEIVPNTKKTEIEDETTITPPEKPRLEENWTLEKSPTISIIVQLFIGLGKEVEGEKNIKIIFDNLTNIGTQIASIIISSVATFLLALLFSFLIVLDLPRLKENVIGFKNTKLRFIYTEVADSIHHFSVVLGQTFEAQFMIAIVNSLLTAILIYLLGLEQHMAFLSVIVFLGSFIPVVGVIISSIPICLIALQYAGLQHMLITIFGITLIHTVEAYILNPSIYGSRLHINPVIVLIILTVAGQLFHVWGLILGVPIFSYFVGHAIRLNSIQETSSPKPIETELATSTQPPLS